MEIKNEGKNKGIFRQAKVEKKYSLDKWTIRNIKGSYLS